MDLPEKESVVATTGLDGVLRLYDINTQSKLLEYYIGCGPIWDQVRLKELDRCNFPEDSLALTHEVLVVGGDDATVRLVFIPRDMSYVTPSTMALVEHLTLRANSKQRVVSVTAELSSDARTLWVWAGTQEGRLHRWDLAIGGAHSSGFTPKSTPPSLVVEVPSKSIPWSLTIYNTHAVAGQVLPTGPHSVVAGDEEGQVTIWDGAMGVLTQTLHHHKADILRVALSPSKESLFAVGVDNTITLFQRSSNTTVLGSMDVDASGVAPWVFVGSRRSHTHDIAAAITGSAALFTGGIDTKLMIHEYRDQLKLPGRSFLPFVQNPALVATLAHGTPSKRDRMVVQLDSRLQIWKLGKPLKNGKIDPKTNHHDILEEQQLLLDITPKVNGRIVCHASSSRAHKLAFSDHTHTKVFYIKERGAGAKAVLNDENGVQANGDASFSKSSSNSSNMLKASGTSIGADEPNEDFLSAFSDPVLTVDKKMTLKGPSARLAFTPNGILVRATANNHLVQLWDVSDADRPSLVHTFHEHASAPRSSIVSSKSTSTSHHSTHRAGAEQAVKPIHLLTVSPNGKYLATSDLHNRVLVFSLESMTLVYTLPPFDGESVTALAFDPEESNLAVALASNKFYVYSIASKSITQWSRENSDSLPKKLTDMQERIIGLVFHPSVPGLIFAYGHTFMFYVHTAGNAHRASKFIKTYQPLFIDFVDQEALAIIERPWLKVIQHLPSPFYRQRYGT